MLVLTVIIGLATAYVNGMHDGGTIVATTVTSRIMKPRSAILLAGLACLLGFVLLGSAVQTTMVSGIVNSGAILAGGGKQAALFAVSAFLGSMVWNLITWAGRLPSSASHSLIGSMIGCSMAVCGMDSVIWSSVMLRVVAAMILSPLTGFALGFLLLKLQNRILRRGTIVWTQRVRALDIVSTFLLALSYGSNEAQKVAGVICLGALASGGGSPSDSLTLPYLPVSGITSLCGLALAIGAMTGGFNMMRTVGRDIVKINTDRAFVSQLSSILVVEIANTAGLPISSTQVITGSVMGVGTEDRPRSMNWEILYKILAAWILTLPAAGLTGAVVIRLMILIPV